MHLADAFIQSDLQCIQAIHLFYQYVSLLDPIGFHWRDSRSEYCRHSWVLLDLVSNHLEHPSNYLVLKHTQDTL